jgi:hypothetical protein
MAMLKSMSKKRKVRLELDGVGKRLMDYMLLGSAGSR